MAYLPPDQRGRKRPRMEEPDQASLIQTSFFMPPTLGVKAGGSNYLKFESQSGVSKRRAEDDFLKETTRAREERRVQALLDEEERRLKSLGGAEAGPSGSTGDVAMEGVEPPAPKAEDGGAAGAPEAEAADPRTGTSALHIPSIVPEPTRPLDLQEQEELIPEAQRTIVIHPGSRYLRIGRATDSIPVSVPMSLYRKKAVPKPAPAPAAAATNGSEGDGGTKAGPAKETAKAEDAPAMEGVEEESAAPQSAVTAESSVLKTATETEAGKEDEEESNDTDAAREEQLTEAIKVARDSLRDRMRFNKLKILPGKPEAGSNQSARYNGNQTGQPIPKLSDPHMVEWLEDYSADKLFPGPDMHVSEDSPYELRYPIQQRTFNTNDYDPAHPEVILSDIQEILEHALGELQPKVDPRKLRNYSVVLIIPDYVEKAYIESMSQLLLQTMGFKQLGILQEAVCATFGAGLSSACIVDIGASRTTVTCVDDGLLQPETRHVLNYGGDDITAFYSELLQRISFPYRELDMSSRLDWALMDDIKTKTCTLMDTYVVHNTGKFHVVRKGSLTREYMFQTYDQPVLASSCIFDPRSMDWAKKDKVRMVPLRTIDEDAIPELVDFPVTLAMQSSAAHLLVPPPVIEAPIVPAEVPSVLAEASQNGEEAAEPKPQVAPAPPPEILAPIVTADAIVKEAGRATLEAAVTNSILALESKASSLASAILVLGGTSLLEGIGPALQWRVESISEQRLGTALKVAILPPPRGMDPRTVVWRGGAVYSRLDSMQELWIKRGEWADQKMWAYRKRVM